ncbi:DUF6615 family protein [Anabaena azotica]|uniref:DUF6615 family protein n=1 Tax=Anabaena azotica TaxID=197653 RepID=UPI0039A536B6
MKAIDVFENLASSTWERIHLGEAYKVCQGEETITDYNLLEIAMAKCPEVNIIKTPKTVEKSQGTDWEWWIGNNRLGWLRYAVQAKKINPNTSRYDALKHTVPLYDEHRNKVGETEQIDILEQYARIRNAIPMYCFYNYVENSGLDDYWHCNLSYEINQFGCTVTPSKNVRAALSERGARKFNFLHKFDNTKPWRCLVRCPLLLQVYQTGSARDTSLGFENVVIYPDLPFDLSFVLETGYLEEFSSEFYSRDIDIYPKRILVAQYLGEDI